MNNNYINEYNLLRYNNDEDFRLRKLENNKKYYYKKKYSVSVNNQVKTVKFGI